MHVSTTSDFSNLVINQSNVTDTGYVTVGLNNNAQYFWRVNASNAGGISPWSLIWNFTTIIDTPAVPTLVSPVNGAVGVAVDPILTWNKSLLAGSYTIQLSTVIDFSTLIIDQNITDTSYKVTGLTLNTLYYWRTCATNAGGASGWSEIRNFTVMITGILDSSLSVEPQKSLYFTVFPSIVTEENKEVIFYCGSDRRRDATVSIYDALGNTVFRKEYLIEPTEKPRLLGTWDLRNRNNRKMARGMYLLVLNARDQNGEIEIVKVKIGIKQDL